MLAGMLLGPAALAQLGLPPVPAENPITEPKRLLGKALFWDEQLSSDSTMACGTCHIPSAGGADPRAGAKAVNPGADGIVGTRDDLFGSLGVRRQNPDQEFIPDEVFGFQTQVTRRAATSVIGAAYLDELFSDGRATSRFVNPETGQILIESGGALESQALGPILSTGEMACDGRSWDDVRVKLEEARPLALAWDLPPDLQNALVGVEAYPELFAEAFGDPDITPTRIAFAIATYERTLTPNRAPVDSYLSGNLEALTENQIDGFDAFWGAEARCIACHLPPLFSDGSYRNIGRRPIIEDEGRAEVTGDPADRGKFKVPSLRNAGLRTTFFHDGQAGSVLDTMLFYNQGGSAHPENVDPDVLPISMTPRMLHSVTDFVENALTDPRVAAEQPPFDRPKLHSEQPLANPELLPGETPGSGGHAPDLIALSPPHTGSPDFKIGIFNGLGGARAILAASLGAPGSARWARIGRSTLVGSGAGQGYATIGMPIPLDPALVGLELWLQAWVVDPGAAGGFALSPVAHLTLF
ncbi:MAG: cytochrome c peroxidase [Chlamydiales bacterium]|jgi:cytochrome c peroxidase